MTSAFYTGDSFESGVLAEAGNVPRVTDVSKIYEIDRCVKWIADNNFKRVALQFPDHLLIDSVHVVQLIEEQLEDVALCVLGDTSYGSCCVDEVAAEHNRSDSIIHFGHSCLSLTRRLPVLLVFVSQEIDILHCVEQFRALYQDVEQRVVIMYDTAYDHCIDEVMDGVQKTHKNVIRSFLNYPTNDKQIPSKSDDKVAFTRCARTFYLPPDAELSLYNMFYIGEESPTLTNLMTNYNTITFSSYNPKSKTGRVETVDINRSLYKRYYKVEKAKDAEIVGIVVGTLGVSDYLHIIDHLKTIIQKAGKKFYLFVMGKLNVPKLANFPEVDVFVFVTCEENTLVDSSEYMKPIVTPFEMEHACNLSRTWTGDYVTDYRSLLPGGSDYCELDDNRPIHYDVSLITGKLRGIGVEEAEVTSTDVSTRDHTTTVANTTAADYLSKRSWQGLEQKLGETPVVDAVEGIKGIASGYSHEGEHS